MREVFVYWRTAMNAAERAETAVRAWQAELRSSWTDLETRLYRRCDEVSGQATVMETYALRGSALPEPLLRHIVDAGNARLAPWLLGIRHVEIFERRPDVSGLDG